MKDKFFKEINLSELGRNNNWRLDISNKHKISSLKIISECKNISICPVCDSNQRELFTKVFGFTYFNCNSCNHLYSGLVPTDKALKSLYAEDDKNSEVESVQREIYANEKYFKKRLNEIAYPKVKFASEIINQRGLWVDIGAGVGDLLLSAQKFKWETIGYESDKMQVEFARDKGVNMHEKYLDLTNTIEEIIDAKVVSLINVLEHLEKPRETIINISNSLKQEAYFLFEVPRFPSISSFANRCFPEISSRNIYSPDHLHLFSDKSIKIILDLAGFEIISCWYFGQDMYELFGNVACKGKVELNSNYHNIIPLINDFQKIIDSNGLSDTMLILAQKK